MVRVIVCVHPAKSWSRPISPAVQRPIAHPGNSVPQSVVRLRRLIVLAYTSFLSFGSKTTCLGCQLTVVVMDGIPQARLERAGSRNYVADKVMIKIRLAASWQLLAVSWCDGLPLPD
jgi:hypothetical protein